MICRWSPLGLALALAAGVMLLLNGLDVAGEATRAAAQETYPPSLAATTRESDRQATESRQQPANCCSGLAPALTFLAARQGADGSYGGIGFTADVVLAVAAAERNPQSFGIAGRPGVLTALETRVLTTTRALDAGALGKLALAAVAGAADPRDFAGIDLPLSLTLALSPTGAFSVEEFDHALAMLGTAALSETVPLSATQWLLDQQLPDGSWDDGTGSGPQPDATALALQALLAAGVAPTETAMLRATAFLSATQNADAGWGLSPNAPTNANSTAFVIQALSALGQNPASPTATWAVSQTTPLSTLLALQQSSGGFAYQQGDPADTFATWQAIPALAGRWLPFVGPREAARRSLLWLKSRQAPNGSFPQFGASGGNAAGTARAIRAIRAAGQEPTAAQWATISGTLPISALIELAPAYLASGRGGAVGNVMLGVLAAGAPYSVTDFAGRNLVLSMTEVLSPAGALDDTTFGVYSHALAMLALQQAGFFSGTLAQSTTAFLLTQPITTSADDAGIALQALAGAGLPRSNEVVSAAISFLLASQFADGGWLGFEPGSSSASSTSEALRGLLAYDVDPRQLQRSQDGRLVSPLQLALAAQRRDGALLAFGGADAQSVTDAIFIFAGGYGYGGAGPDEFPVTVRNQRLALIIK